MAIAAQKHIVLACNCGDCLHWEIIKEHNDADLHLLCKTCGKEFHAANLDSFTELKWVEREAI